jgi:hypothetical protein
VHTTSTVTPKALIRRINRKLSAEQKVVGKTQGRFLSAAIGTYYLRDFHGNRGTIRYLTLRELESMARGLQVLADGETVMG